MENLFTIARLQEFSSLPSNLVEQFEATVTTSPNLGESAETLMEFRPRTTHKLAIYFMAARRPPHRPEPALTSIASMPVKFFSTVLL